MSDAANEVPCGVCGAPRPTMVGYCRACGHYDTWWDRRALRATLRQVFLGTVVVGMLGITVDVVTDAAVRDSDERQAIRERENAISEAQHEELSDLRERLIRLTFRMTSETVRCPFAGGTSGPERCIEHVRRLRQEVRQELFALDWTAPLLFAQIDARTEQDMGSSQIVEAALDVATAVGKSYEKTVDRLDVRWANECNGDGTVETCKQIQDCRRKYATAETQCATFVACHAFRGESVLLAGIASATTPYESASCKAIIEKRSACGDPGGSEPQALPGVLCRLVLGGTGDCTTDWKQSHDACKELATKPVLPPAPPLHSISPTPVSDPDPPTAQ